MLVNQMHDKATPLSSNSTYAHINICQLNAHINHMASPAAAGSSGKRKRVVLSIEDKLKIWDLAESGRSWSTIRHTNEHYCINHFPSKSDS